MNHDNSPLDPRRAWTAALALLLALALAVPASAQEHGDGPYLSATWGFVGKAEFDDHAGEVATSTASVGGGYEWLSLSYHRTDYSWSDKDALPFGNRSGDPWDSLHSLALASEHDGMFDNDWGWFAGLEVEAAFEEEMSGSLGLLAYGGGVYMVSDSTAIRFGLAASGHETGMDFLPLLMVGWNNIGPDGSGWHAALGIPQTMLGYSFSEDVSLALELGMEGATYRLADDSEVWSKGYVGHDEMDLRLAAEWSPLENLSLSLGPSYRFGRSMTIYDDSGEEVESYDLGNAAGVSLDLSIAF